MNVTFRYVCLCVFGQIKKEILKLIKYNLKYKDFCSVFLLNAAYRDETCKALIYTYLF